MADPVTPNESKKDKYVLIGIAAIIGWTIFGGNANIDLSGIPLPIIAIVAFFAFSYTPKDVAAIGKPIALVIILLTLASGGIGKWAGSNLDSINRSAESRSMEIDRGITVYRDFLVKVPAGNYSESIANTSGRCLRWRRADGEQRPMPPTETRLHGQRWKSFSPNETISEIRWSGHSFAKPYRVRVQIRNRNQCNEW